ncbi:MAG TPA: outer membrane protein assembly factor BamD [Bryobacteraceae bacterium]|nr:outer membrane protein assembly factor BamD [Bryobacteraceae bacterium]
MFRYYVISLSIVGLLCSCGFRRHKYDNPITKDTQQPDKVLYDKAVNDIEHGRFEVARITLNTLINTYDQSEFLAKAKLAIADSWYREGGLHGLAQAEAEYKDFILFYPTMEEAAESQMKICQIHYKQMDKPDRDQQQAIRAEDECRQLLVQFPNSQFRPEAEQLLRNIQEALGESEYRVGAFYHKKNSNPAAANRLQRLVDQYPLYSRADEALYELGDSYSKMGTRFRQRSGEAFARIVRSYPLSPLVDDAKKRLQEMEMPVPEADPAALALMKYNQEHRDKGSMVGRSLDFMRRGPDVRAASKTGSPAMENVRPSVPASVPTPAGATGFNGEVTATTVSGGSALDTQPDARSNPSATGAIPGAAATTPATGTGTTGTQGATPGAPAAGATAPEPLPMNATYQPKGKPKKQKKPKKGQEQQVAPAQAAQPQSQSSTPQPPTQKQ